MTESVSLSQAFETVRHAVLSDPEYAWAWYGNVLAATHRFDLNSEEQAALFMKDVFGLQRVRPPGLAKFHNGTGVVRDA